MSKKQEKQELDEKTELHLNVMLTGYLRNVEDVKTHIIRMQTELEQAQNTQVGMEEAIKDLRDILGLPHTEPPPRMPTTITEQ
jgi:hypothetical protein